MQLRSGTPLWTADAPATDAYSPLSGDTNCQVLVLGGGITGALVAYRLIELGIATVLLEKRNIGRSSTAASTGLLQYEVDTPLVKLIDHVGEAHAVHAYRRGLTAIDEIEALLEVLGNRCGFSRRSSLYFASHWWHQRRLAREYECRKSHGFDVDFLSRRELAAISSIRAAGALRSRGDGQIDPYAFTRRLVERAVSRGLVVHSNTPVTKIAEVESEVLVRTRQGTISADTIVYATGYEAQQHLDQSRGNFQSTYAVASAADSDLLRWPDRSLIWETSRPYFYARQTDDGRAIIGGADTAFSNDHQRDGLVDRKVEKLVRRFERLFPAARFVPEFAWAGTFAETKDGLAYIGQPDNRPRAYFALGYGGNGITFGVIAARLIADLITGTPNADAPVFRFGR